MEITASTLIIERLERIGIDGKSISAEALERFDRYLALLKAWNKATNLTALSLDPFSPDAIDRLIVEPIAASRLLDGTHGGASSQTLLDLGSGGGSPAIPLAVMLDPVRLLMVESRSRKCAFLREAVRQLGLDGQVYETRFEQLSNWELAAVADVVSIRAVRLDAEMQKRIEYLLAPAGKVLSFGSRHEPPIPPSWRAESEIELNTSTPATLRVLVPRGTFA